MKKPKPNLKINLNKYLLHSSVFAIFTEALKYRFIIDLKLFYLILFINFFLLFKYKKFTLNHFFLSFFAFLFIHGCLTYLWIGIPPNFMLSQILGIALASSYFYNVLKLFTKEDVFILYAKYALFLALIGFPGYFFGFNLNVNYDPRFSSLLTEPAHYAIVVLPACYFYFKRKQYVSFFVIFLSLILSESSIGYIGCALMFILPYINLQRVKYALGVIPFVLVIFYFVYSNNEKVKTRFDDTFESLKVLETGKFDVRTNISTYALLSNLYIAKENFIEHPLGSGIGSHYYMYHNSYKKKMRTPKYLYTLELDDINSKDATSLFIRLISEFGIIGILATFYMIILIVRTFKDKSQIVEQSIGIYILLKLFRDGHYFPPELFFFLLIFYFSYTKSFFFKNEGNLSHN